MTRMLRAGGAAALLALAAIGCETRTIGFATTGPSGGVDGGGGGAARVRLFNAITSAGPVDFLVDGRVVASGVDFGSASPYVSVPSGNRRLQVRSSSTSTGLIDFSTDVADQGSFTLLPAPGLQQFGALFLSDQTSPVSGQARIRVVHAAAAAGLVDIYLAPADTPLSSAAATLTGVPLGLASAYINVAPGTYRVWVTVAGQRANVLLESGPHSFAANLVRTLVLTDAPSGGLPPALSIVSDAG